MKHLIDTQNAQRISEVASRLRENVQRVIVGATGAIDLAIVALLCRGHVLVEDVPGIGKTTLTKVLAQSMGCAFKRIQFTPDLMPSDVLGVNFFNQKASEFEFRPGPVFSQVLLADEINRATPRTQAALLEAMQERQSTIDGETYPLPEPFLVIATQNPVEMEGTFPLPEAQLDRFMVRVRLGYPTPEDEDAILRRFEHTIANPSVEPVTEAGELRQMQELVTTVRVDPNVRSYIVAVVQATREHTGLSLGASPRASLALYRCCQANAALEGRDFVSPDDVKALASPVLAHRMLITSNSRLRGRTADHVIEEILGTAPVPIER